MQDIGVVADLPQALDDVAGAGRLRVALGGDDDGHRVLWTPTKRTDLVELADSGRMQQPAKWCGQARQDDLRLRVSRTVR
jgi:hypothetical protein